MSNRNQINVDLHNHTIGSDGKQSPFRLMLRAKAHNIDKISITDHSSIKGYKIFEKQMEYFTDLSIKNCNSVAAKRIVKILDEVSILSGVEVITSYKGVIIEILGYDINVDSLERQLEDRKKTLKTTKEVLYEGLNNVIKKNGLKFDTNVLENVNALVGPFYEELMSHAENEKLLNEPTSADTLKKFIYNHLYNPDSLFFVDMSETRPTMDETIEMIHNAGGKAFLAHPGRYKKLNMQKELDGMILHGLDGIEVYYPDHDSDFKNFLIQKTEEYGIEISGGSDDHANKREGEQYKIGNITIEENDKTKWVSGTSNFVATSINIQKNKDKLNEMLENEEER